MKRQTQLINLAQLLLAPLPAYLLSRHILSGGQSSSPAGFSGLLKSSTTTVSSFSSLSPFQLANLLLAFSLFLGWLASLLQSSTWLIDPYWTLVPPLLDAFYRKACSSSSSSSSSNSKDGLFSSSSPRAAAATLLLLLWSLRLTHSYFRRERFRLGDREDWRYAEMRREWGRHWWWWQLVPVYAVQHFLLVGLAVPSFALRCCCSSPPSGLRLGGLSLWRFYRGGAGRSGVAAPPPSWHSLDSLAVAAALSGLALASVADSQLHAFVSSREEQEKKRRGRAAVLESGLWSLSRHPNYLGETIFHLSLAALAVSGRYFSASSSSSASSSPPPPPPPRLLSLSVLWPLAGAALNTACLVAVTAMTERRTATARGRARAWEGYCSRVPCWIPRVGPVLRALTWPSGAAADAASGTKPAARPRARRTR